MPVTPPLLYFATPIACAGNAGALAEDICDKLREVVHSHLVQAAARFAKT